MRSGVNTGTGSPQAPPDAPAGASGERLFRALIEHSSDAVSLTSADGTILYVTPSTSRVLGYPENELIGTSAFDRFHPEDQPALVDLFHQLLASPGGSVTYEFRYRHKDGSWRWMEGISTNLLAEREVGAIVNTYRDITERKHAEDALGRVRNELEAFSYTVAHDLRTPLQSIHGFAEVLLDDYGDRLDAKGQDFARRIVVAAERMDALIEDLLTYSRLSRTGVELGPIALDAVVSDVVEQLGRPLGLSGAQVTVDRPLPDVLGNYMTAVQVVANLVSNAIKFVAPGSRPQIRIWADHYDRRVRLWVEDKGIGIRDEDRERVFRVFERLHGSSYPGSGIGLAIVQRGVERMGGRAGVESEPGQGSRFWLELPISESNDAMEAS